MRPRTSLALLALLPLVSCSAAGGLVDGRLAPCPWTPNCATTDADGASLAPLPFTGDPELALDALVELLVEEERATLVERAPRYAHLVTRTRVLRFPDDVELRLDATEGVVHVRSASRYGLWDLGANRRRIERIAERWRSTVPRAAGG